VWISHLVTGKRKHRDPSRPGLGRYFSLIGPSLVLCSRTTVISLHCSVKFQPYDWDSELHVCRVLVNIDLGGLSVFSNHRAICYNSPPSCSFLTGWKPLDIDLAFPELIIQVSLTKAVFNSNSSDRDPRRAQAFWPLTDILLEVPSLWSLHTQLGISLS
jgi:hypothetical protein